MKILPSYRQVYDIESKYTKHTVLAGCFYVFDVIFIYYLHSVRLFLFAIYICVLTIHYCISTSTQDGKQLHHFKIPSSSCPTSHPQSLVFTNFLSICIVFPFLECHILNHTVCCLLSAAFFIQHNAVLIHPCS